MLILDHISYIIVTAFLAAVPYKHIHDRLFCNILTFSFFFSLDQIF